MQEIFNIQTASIKYTSRKYANKKKKTYLSISGGIGFGKDAVDKK